jgi:adenosylhomocysteine nucleosidase
MPGDDTSATTSRDYLSVDVGKKMRVSRRSGGQMKLGIMGAMPEETAGIVRLLGTHVTHRIGSREYHVGISHGIETVVVFSRWGKVAASATATTLLTHFGVDGILLIGVAGGIDPALKPADIVIADKLLQYDIDASALGAFQRFEVPLLGQSRFSPDKAWAAAAQSAASAFVADALKGVIDCDIRLTFPFDGPKIVSGLIATGDRFIADAGPVESLRKMLPDLRCVEMEGAAVGQVCYEFDRPYAIIRIISDRADHSAPIDFGQFVSRVATVMSTHICDHFIQQLAEETPAFDAPAQTAISISNRDPAEAPHPGDLHRVPYGPTLSRANSRPNAEDVIRILELKPHPEGGHYRETFRDDRRDSNDRAVSTAILFLLKAGEVSAWHRVDAAELWHYHAGAPIMLATKQDGQEVRFQHLGSNLTHGESPQIAIPAGQWQSACSLGPWTLVSCTVAPGFQFNTFEMAPPGWKPAADTALSVASATARLLSPSCHRSA